MGRDEHMVFSLTAENSHSAIISAGQGILSIGAVGMDKKKFDVLVEEDLAINWHAFDHFYTLGGGHWPRVFRYWGNDIGFIEWSKERPIENFIWYPSKAFSIHLNNSQIRSFSIIANQHPIKLIIENQQNKNGLYILSLEGNIENFDIVASNINPYLAIAPNTNKSATQPPYKLPIFASFTALITLDITVEPLGQAFDCESLLQFPQLRSLQLRGNITNLNCLKQLKYLRRIAIRYTPNLDNFPPLDSWENLDSFIGWNIEEKAGKRFRAELKQLKKEKEFSLSTVSQLRSAIWFTTEYGIPFANWPTKNARIATKAYKTAGKEIAKAQTEKEVKLAIVTLLEIINTLPNIETEEREDTVEAIEQLIAASSLNISSEKAYQWFVEILD